MPTPLRNNAAPVHRYSLFQLRVKQRAGKIRLQCVSVRFDNEAAVLCLNKICLAMVGVSGGIPIVWLDLEFMRVSDPSKV
jgi:hypothetical protein